MSRASSATSFEKSYLHILRVHALCYGRKAFFKRYTVPQELKTALKKKKLNNDARKATPKKIDAKKPAGVNARVLTRFQSQLKNSRR